MHPPWRLAQIFCSITANIVVVYVLGGFMLEDCSFLCDCFKKCFFVFLNVSGFTSGFCEQGWSWQNFPIC